MSDNEAILVKAAKTFCTEAAQDRTELSWHGRILNLVTKVAFEDFAESDGATIKSGRSLQLFSPSTQKTYFEASNSQVPL